MDVAGKRTRFDAIEREMARGDFWDNAERAQTLVGELSSLKVAIEPAEKLDRDLSDLEELLELVDGPDDADSIAEIARDVQDARARLAELTTASMLSGPDDDRHSSLRASHGGFGHSALFSAVEGEEFAESAANDEDRVRRAGAGVMGGGIAWAFTNKDIPVRLKDSLISQPTSGIEV